jgi:hypothetical protein
MHCLHRSVSELTSDGVFFYLRRLALDAVKQQGLTVLDVPFNGFAFLQAEAACQRGREGDVPLLAGLTLDELDFGGVSHVALLV